MKVHKKMSLSAALLVAVLSFGGFMGIATFVTQNNLGFVSVSSADDSDEEGDDEDEDEDEDKDENKDEDEDKDDDEQSESEKKASEALKKKAEKEREAAKKAAERSNRESDDEDDADELENEGEDSSKDDDEDEREDGDDNGMYRDRAKTLAALAEDIAEAEKEILQKQSEGVDVTAALARLALAKAGIDSVDGAFDSNNLEDVKRLSKEVKKLAHFAKEEDLHDAKEAAEDVAKISKRIAQAYGKVTLLESVGGDGAQAKVALAALEVDFAALQVTIAAGGYDLSLMESSLESLERKVKAVKSSVEASIYALGGTDGKYDDDYEEEADDVYEYLNDVAEIEDDNVGRVISGIAKEHKDAAKIVSEKVSAVDQRSLVLQTLFGANEGDLRALDEEIVNNNDRIAMLIRAADAIEDQEVKQLLLDQVAVLKVQTAKLETFVGGQRDRLSVFGWFFNLF